MRVLVLGYSSLVRRRILPALASLGVDVDVASVTRRPIWPSGFTGRAFSDYGQGLAESRAEFVYVSTRNHDHAKWVAAAQDAGRHVIVDKPAALSLNEVETMAARAARDGRLAAEATTWTWHPQVSRLVQLIGQAQPVTRAVAVFSFPPLPPEDVRYRREWGGGALLDLGPYAVSCGRLLFGALPEDVCVRLIAENGRDVETAFSLLARYPDNRFLVGHFGFTTAYVNRLEVMGPSLILALERAFTSAPDQPCRIAGQYRGEPLAEEIPATDAFARFLSDALNAPANKDLARYREAMLADALALAKLRAAAIGPAS